MVNAILFVASSIVGYLACEAAVYLALCFGLPLPVHPYYNYSAWSNARFMTADPVIGMRLRPNEPNDGIRIIRGDVQFYYHDIRGNSAGFYSDHEYVGAKQRPYRIAVYGDSYTAMLYQQRTWPDYLHQLYTDAGIEVYNFSFDGGGLANWSQHYWHELTPKYEFDMVVFAICCNDLLRAFTFAETRAEGFFLGQFARPPQDLADFDHNYRPRLGWLLPIATRQFLARLRGHFADHAFLLLPADLYILRTIQLSLSARAPQPAPSAAPRVSSEQSAMLRAMVKDMRRRDKTSVLLALPWLRDRPDPAIEDIRTIAEEGCSAFINGYDLFRSVGGIENPEYWSRYDGHWLQAGAERFAELLAPELLRVRDRRLGAANSCH
jgi:GDSL-like Lipase/Acylhydrolase family